MGIKRSASEELLASAKQTKTSEEILTFALEDGVELYVDVLDKIAGGSDRTGTCPECGSKQYYKYYTSSYGQPGKTYFWECESCGYRQ